MQEVRSLQEVEQMQLPSSVFLTVEAIKSLGAVWHLEHPSHGHTYAGQQTVQRSNHWPSHSLACHRSTTYFKLDGETKPAPSELLQSLPLEIRNALERQAQSPCSAASPPAAVASALSTPVTAAISALTPAPRPRSFCWTACGTATLATCGALARAAALSTRGAIYLGGRLCSASEPCLFHLDSLPLRTARRRSFATPNAQKPPRSADLRHGWETAIYQASASQNVLAKSRGLAPEQIFGLFDL